MRVVLVENDDLQAEQIVHDIKASFGPTNVTIDCIRTEYEFRQRIDDIAQIRPAVVILDVMVRWTDPVREMPEIPREVAMEGHYRAGLRCARLLTEKEPRIPIILYTVLDKADLIPHLQSLGPNVHYLPKEANVAQLTKKIRELIQNDHQVSSP